MIKFARFETSYARCISTSSPFSLSALIATTGKPIFSSSFAGSEDDTFGSDFEAIVADSRYKYISKNYSTVVVKNKNGERERISSLIA